MTGLHLDRRADTTAAHVAEAAPDQLLTFTQVADYIGCHPVSLRRWVKSGDGPRVVRPGLKTVRVKKADLLTWLESRAEARPVA